MLFRLDAPGGREVVRMKHYFIIRLSSNGRLAFSDNSSGQRDGMPEYKVKINKRMQNTNISKLLSF